MTQHNTKKRQNFQSTLGEKTHYQPSQNQRESSSNNSHIYILMTALFVLEKPVAMDYN